MDKGFGYYGIYVWGEVQVLEIVESVDTDGVDEARITRIIRG